MSSFTGICCFCTGLSVYALSSVSAAEIDRLMREATRKRSTSISCGYADGKVELDLNLLNKGQLRPLTCYTVPSLCSIELCCSRIFGAD